MRVIKKWILRGVALIAILLAVVVIGIEIKKDRIIHLAVAGINDNINGTFSHGTASVSFLTSLPYLKISLFDIEIVDHSALQPLANLDELNLSVNLGFIFTKKREPELSKFSISNGIINVISLANGDNNYSIQKAIEENTDTKSVNFRIEEYELNNIDITYFDEESNQLITLEKGHYRGSLNYIDDHIIISGNNQTELTYKAGAMSPVINLSFNSNLELKAASIFSDIQIENSNFRVNNLNLNLNGRITEIEKGYDYNIEFDGSGNDVKNVASLISVFNNDQYAELESTGTLNIEGKIDGNSTVHYPTYDIHAGIENGSLFYPTAPNNIKEIAFTARLKNTTSHQPISQLSINNLTIKTNRSRLLGDISFTDNGQSNTLHSDLNISMNLEEIAQIAPYSDIDQLKGIISGNITGNLEIDESGQLSNVSKFISRLTAKDILYQSNNISTTIGKAVIAGNENKLTVDLSNMKSEGQYAGAAKLDVIAPFTSLLNSNQETEVSITAELDYFLMPDSSSSRGTSTYSIPSLKIPLDLKIDRLEYGNYMLNGIKVNGTVSNAKSNLVFNIDELNGQSLAGTANLEQLLGYALNNDTLVGTVEIQSNNLNIDELLGSSSVSTSDNTLAVIPANIDLGINYTGKNVTYKNITIGSAVGQIVIDNQQVIFKNESEIFGGKLGLTGAFDGRVPSKNTIELSAQISNSLLSEGSKALPFANYLLPIGEFIEGQFNATLNWQSELSADYIPIFSSISSNGFLETSNGRINGLKPLNELGKYLTDDIANIWQLANTKSWFVIKDGFVILDEINLSQKNIDIRLSGAFSLEGEMDYQLKLSAPVNEIKLTELGDAFQSINSQLNKLKVLDDFTNIDLSFALQGSVTNPRLKLRGANISSISSGKTLDHVLEERVEEKIDDVKNRVDSIIQDAATEIENKVDSVKTTVDSIINLEKQELEQDAKLLLDSLKAGNIDIFKNIDSLFKKKKTGLGSKIKLPKNFKGLE